MDGAMYLHALRERDPETFKRLCKSGELERHVIQKVQEAAQIFQEITRGLQRDVRGKLLPHVASEAEEYVRAEILNFPRETSQDQDEVKALFGGEPII